MTARAVTCSGNNDCASGCYLDNNSCTECPEGKYCTGGSTQPTSCPAPFNSSFKGAKNKTDCYAKVECKSTDFHSEGSVYAGILYADLADPNINNNCESNYSGELYQAQNGSEYCLLNSTVAPINNNNFWNGWGNNDPDCRNEQAINCFSRLFHIETRWGATPGETQFECYANNKPLGCSQFAGGLLGTQNTNCVGGTITGQSTWNNNDLKWDVSQCKCEIEGDFTTTVYCVGKKTLEADTGTDVKTIQENIVFSPTPVSYYCNRCDVDNSNSKYYADTNSSFSNCTLDLSSGKVCKCNYENQRGYYRTGKCNNASQTWANDDDICKLGTCPYGKTTHTNDLLPVVNDDNVCEYDDTTKFCDAKGCFNLTFSDWNFN